VQTGTCVVTAEVPWIVQDSGPRKFRVRASRLRPTTTSAALSTTDDPFCQSQDSELEKYHSTDGYGNYVNSNDPNYEAPGAARPSEAPRLSNRVMKRRVLTPQSVNSNTCAVRQLSVDADAVRFFP
jgi:hypothetical protein